MNIRIKKPDSSDIKKVKALYTRAFPKEERAPFFLLRSRIKSGKGKLLVAKDKGEFVGFAYMVCENDLAYLFYFAVDDSKRSKGYGTAIVKKLIKIYNGKRLFLAREQLDKSADNYRQRVKRHEFYLHCGLKDMPCRIKEAGVIYDVMGIGGNIKTAEYKSLMTKWAGSFLMKIIDVRLLEDRKISE